MRSMRGILKILFPVLLVIAIIYGVFRGQSWKWDLEREKFYNAVPVAIRDVESIIYTRGNIRAKSIELVLAETNSVVSKIAVKAGETVSKNQVLAYLDSENLLKQIEQKQLSLQIDKNNYLNAQEQAYRLLEEAEQNYEDMKGLHRLQFASENELAKALQELEDAKKEAVVNTLDSSPTELENKYLKYKQSELILAGLNKDLMATTIESPIDGIVTAIYIEDSDAVYSNKKLFEIAVLDELEVHTTVGEHDANDVQLGMNVTITGDAFQNEYEGKVTSIGTSSIVKGSDSVVEVIIDIEDEQYELKHNLIANADILVSSAKHAVTVPVDAIGINVYGETVVIEARWDADLESFRYIPLPVLVGVQNNEYAQVISEEVQVGIKVIEIYKPELDPDGKIK